METEGEHLVTDKALFQIKDRRGYNQYLTDPAGAECLDPTENQADQTEVLLVTNHVESNDSMLSDLESKLTEVEMMNDLQLHGVRQSHSEELWL